MFIMINANEQVKVVSCLRVNYEFVFSLASSVNANAKDNFLVHHTSFKFQQGFACGFQSAPTKIEYSLSISQLKMALDQVEQIFALNKKLNGLLGSPDNLKFEMKFKEKSQIQILNDNGEVKNFDLVDYASFKEAVTECRKWCSIHKLNPETMYAKRNNEPLETSIPRIKHAKGMIDYHGKCYRYLGYITSTNYVENFDFGDLEVTVQQNVDLSNTDKKYLDPQKYFLLEYLTHYAAKLAWQIEKAFFDLTSRNDGRAELKFKPNSFYLLFAEEEKTLDTSSSYNLQILDHELSDPHKRKLLTAHTGLRTPLLLRGAPSAEDFFKRDILSSDNEKQSQDTLTKTERAFRYLCC